MRSSKGFTVVEILVAVLLAGIITTAAFSLYLTQHKQFIVQDGISDMHSNIRAATAEIATRARMAGYNIPLGGQDPIVASDTNPDTLSIAYEAGLREDIQIEHAMPRPSAELRCDGHNLSELHDNDWLYIYDPGARSGEFFLATQIQYSSSHIQHNTMPLSRAYPQGSKILKINRYKYYIDQSDPNHPNMMIQLDGLPAQTYADNITDLNVTYLLSSGDIVDVPLMVDMVREVIVTVAARTDKVDNNFHSPYRTRLLTTRVKVRNLGVN
jgi:prepilin-type N-terminal cleavage/methylation domain-containing protein